MTTDITSAITSAAAALGRKGGSAKSEAKTAAVRANGAKGGRPSRKYKFEVAFPNEGQGDGLLLIKWTSQPEDQSQGDLYIIEDEDARMCHGHAYRKGGEWTAYGTAHPDDML